MKDKFAEIAAKETYRAKSIKGNVYNWNTTNQFMQQDFLYFLYKKRRTLYIAF